MKKFLIAMLAGLFLLQTTACIQSVVSSEVPQKEGQWMTIFNNTGEGRNLLCGASTNAIFVFTNGESHQEYAVNSGDSYFAFIEVKTGEDITVSVRDAHNDSPLTTGTVTVNPDRSKSQDSSFLPTNTIQLCPKDELRFLNF